MTDIYDMINDIDFDTDAMELNDIEKVKLRKTAKSYAKKDNKKKFMASAAAILLFAGLMAPQVRAEVLKFTTDIKVSMMDAIGASPESYKYVTELNSLVTVGNDDFVIGNIAFEDDQVYINTLRESDGSIDSLLSEKWADIYKVVIDGQTYKSEGRTGGSHYLEDGKTMSNVTTIHFDKEFPSVENADVDLYFSDAKASEIISIKADVNTVNEDNIILAKEKKLDNGAVVSLIKINPLTMTVKIENLDPAYLYKLEALDNSGNRLIFNSRSDGKGNLTFVYEHEVSDLSLDQIKEADELKFTLKRTKMNFESGRLSDSQYEKAAEFTTVMHN